MARIESVCTLCGFSFDFGERRTRVTVRDGRRAHAIEFHAECNPRAIAKLRAELRTERRIERHLRERDVPIWRERWLAPVLSAKAPPPPPDHVFWWLLRSLRRSPPNLREAMLTRWSVSARIDYPTRRSLAAFAGRSSEATFPPLRSMKKRAATKDARTIRVESDEGLVIIRTFAARPHAYAYLRHVEGITARSRPKYRDEYIGRIALDAFKRRRPRELAELVDALQLARASEREPE